MEWREIPGLQGNYEVSEFGNFRRVLSNGQRRPKAQHTDRAGYLRANLYVNGVKRTVQASGAVAEAFIGPRPEGMEVCHIDGNHQNNHFTNLRYDTVLNNRRDKITHGTHRNQNNKTHCRNGHVWTRETTRFVGNFKQRICECGSI